MSTISPSEYLKGAPWSGATLLIVLALLAVNFALAIWGFVQSFVSNYAEGAQGNNYTAVWINAFTWVLTVQAISVTLIPGLTISRPARFFAWCWYLVWMFTCTISLLVGMHYKELVRQYAWALLWFPPIGVLAAAVAAHHQNNLQQGLHGNNKQVDVEANPPAAKPRNRTLAAWNRCCFKFWAFCGWSSMFWLSFLGFFLALQAAWLVTDQRIHAPLGKLYRIDLQDGSGYQPRIHMACKGPSDTGLSTFIMEAGGGSPGVAYAGIVDELAAAGRRACWYDRLGYGWSDDAILYGAADQSAVVLYNTLAAAGDRGPYIVAGHSAGGQLGMMFAGYHPDNVSGIALLDSYDDAAIALGYTGANMVNVTLPSGRKVVRPEFTHMTKSLQLLTDAVRAITPFGWARFITMSHGNYPYRDASNAAYGNNKEWQTQWLTVSMAINGVSGNSDVLSDLAYQLSNGTVQNLWHGTAWPDISPKPALLLPAQKTLQPGIPEGCDVFDLQNNVTCQNKILSCDDKSCVYPNLYVTYMRTMSSNMRMKVMPGGHSFPSDAYKETANALLERFSGV